MCWKLQTEMFALVGFLTVRNMENVIDFKLTDPFRLWWFHLQSQKKRCLWKKNFKNHLAEGFLNFSMSDTYLYSDFLYSTVWICIIKLWPERRSHCRGCEPELLLRQGRFGRRCNWSRENIPEGMNTWVFLRFSFKCHWFSPYLVWIR